MDAQGRGRGLWRAWAGLIASAWRTVRAGGARLIALILLFQLLLLAVVSPALGWLFREALRANGMVALDLGTLRLTGGAGITVALLALIGTIAFWIVSLQFTVILAAIQRARHGLPITARPLLRDLGATARKLRRPDALPLAAYVFVVLPLSGFGFVSVLAQGIAVPPFISGELLKSPASAAAWGLFVAALLWLTVRLALTLPLTVLTDAGGARALRLSWRATRGLAALPLVAAAVAVLAAAGVATLFLVVAALVPTAVADELAPASAPTVAAFSLGAAQAVGLVLTALVTALLAALLVAALERSADRLPPGLAPRSPRPGAPPRLSARATAGVGLAAGVLGALALGAAAIPTLEEVSRHPDTMVLAHRGFSAGGVENTICGLEAAAAVGADRVEMDTMQTKDGRYVVMHDANLSRLTGEDLLVRDLTLAELTAMTARAGDHSCRIPSLDDYVERAIALDMPLLIEIKLSGAEGPDHVAELVARLESLDALERNIYHTLDAASAEALKRLRPDLTVGYIMAFAGEDPPATAADFLVVEEWSATEALQRNVAAAGYGFWAWTVNDPAHLREHLRRGTDGMITDRPDAALADRAEMRAETGFAGTLVDALTRFVVVF